MALTQRPLKRRQRRPVSGRQRRQLNPRQRQGLLLVVLAAAGLVAVFVLIAGYVASVSRQVGPMVQVLTLTRPLTAYTAVTPEMVGEKSVPAKWASPRALRDPSEAIALISPVPLSAGTDLEQGMLEQAPQLSPHYQEMALNVDAETGVAGQLTPGSLVNVVGAFAATQTTRSSAQVVAAGVKVLGVASATGSSNGQGSVLLEVTPRQSQALTWAESNAQRLRLVLLPPGTTSPQTVPAPYQPNP